MDTLYYFSSNNKWRLTYYYLCRHIADKIISACIIMNYDYLRSDFHAISTFIACSKIYIYTDTRVIYQGKLNKLNKFLFYTNLHVSRLLIFNYILSKCTVLCD